MGELMAQTGSPSVTVTAPQVAPARNGAPKVKTDAGAEVGDRLATVTFCIPADELQVLRFAAKEFGQTLSSFCYVRIRNELRAMKLLPIPAIPKVNGGAGNG